MKILVIDNNESIRHDLKVTLEGEGYEVLTAGTGRDGLEIFARELPSIVLVEINMDDIGGIEVLKRVKEQHPDVQVIVISDDSEADLAIQALQNEAIDFIGKPIREEALSAALVRSKERFWKDDKLRGYVENLEKLIRDTTEELEKRHELEHNLIQTSMDGIIANDRQGNIIIFNEGAESIYGYTREEAVSTIDVTQLYAEGVAKKIKKMIYGPEYGGPGRLVNYEVEILTKNGKLVPILLSATLLYEEGHEVATVGYFKDMREVKRLEKELVKRYEFEHNLVQTSMDGIIANDRQGNIIIFNEGAESIYGYTREEAVSTIHVTQLYAEGVAKKIKKMIYGPEYGGPGRLVNYEVEILTKNGELVPILLSATLLYEEGHEVATVGYFKDMREVKRLEKELIKRYEFEHNLVQTSMDGIIANDRQGNIIIFNEGAERICGYIAEEAIIGINVSQLYPEGVARKIKKLTYGSEYGGPGRLVNYEVEVRTKNGELVPILLSATLLYEEGREVAMVGYFKDMREVKRLEKELIQRERLAAMGQATAGIAHGVKNILHAMKLGAFMVDKGFEKEKPDLLRKGWNLVGKNMNRISRMTLDMLSYARSSPPARQSCSLNEIIDQVCDLMIEKARERQIDLVRDLDSSLPPVSVDGEDIHSCLMNLVTNAIEAFPESSTGGVITVSSRDAGEAGVHLHVKDTGKGMTRELQEQIFKYLYSTKGARGTGLGLAITQKIIHEHGGTIEVDSTPNEGSCFTIVLPKQ